MNEAAAWVGRIWRAPIGAVFQGRGGPTSAHAHPAFKIGLGVDVRGDVRAAGGCSLVAPGQRHIVTAESTVTLVYLDARFVDQAGASRLAERLVGAGARVDFDALCEDVARVRRRRMGPKLEAMLDTFVCGASRDEASTVGQRSTSTFTHAVTNELGVAPRMVRSWARMLAAVDAVATGQTITTAAHEAGFSDAAHLWRQSRALLGIAPSRLVRSRWSFGGDRASPS
jgi:AraC-like DNA-binding protein